MLRDHTGIPSAVVFCCCSGQPFAAPWPPGALPNLKQPTNSSTDGWQTQTTLVVESAAAGNRAAPPPSHTLLPPSHGCQAGLWVRARGGASFVTRKGGDNGREHKTAEGGVLAAAAAAAVAVRAAAAAGGCGGLGAGLGWVPGLAMPTHTLQGNNTWVGEGGAGGTGGAEGWQGLSSQAGPAQCVCVPPAAKVPAGVQLSKVQPGHIGHYRTGKVLALCLDHPREANDRKANWLPIQVKARPTGAV